LLKQGFRNVDISKKLHMSPSSISKIKFDFNVFGENIFKEKRKSKRLSIFTEEHKTYLETTQLFDDKKYFNNSDIKFEMTKKFPEYKTISQGYFNSLLRINGVKLHNDNTTF